MWGKKNKDDYMNNSYYDDGTGSRTPIQNKLNKNNKSFKAFIPIILVIIIGSVIYNVSRSVDNKNNTTTSYQVSVNKKYEEVDSYLVKFDEFSKEGYNFLDEIISIYTDNDYSVERLNKLEEWGKKIEEYDFSSFKSSKYSKGNTNIETLKTYIKDLVSLIKEYNISGIDIYDSLNNLIDNYDSVDAEYMNIIIELLEGSGIKYEKKEDGGVDYWLY